MKKTDANEAAHAKKRKKKKKEGDMCIALLGVAFSHKG